MRAILLSAGQGKRLLPLTATDPKCLLPVDGQRTVLDVQLDALERCGIREATVLVGFGAQQVERHLAATPRQRLRVATLYNPFYAVTDNLATCWMARESMTGDFVLLNGDTLFEDAVLRRVLDESSAPISVTIDKKDEYDGDDMKVTLDPDGRLRAIGKKLPVHTVDGESIGLLVFRDAGVKAWRDALDRAIRQSEALRKWYLSVVDEMAQKMSVATVCVEGLWWAEIDDRADLDGVRGHFLQDRIHD